MPRLPDVTGDYSSSVAHGLADQEKNPQQKEPKKVEEGGPLQTELDGLQEILKNQIASQEPGGGEEVRNAGSVLGQSECQDIVFGERAR